LFGSVMLIVAVAVGYVARRADLSHSRDVRLEAAASIASANLGGFVKAAELAAEVGSDPGAAAEALAGSLAGATVCVATHGQPDEPACTTDDPELVERAEAMLATGERDVRAIDADRIELTVVGASGAVHAVVPIPDPLLLDGIDLSFDTTTDVPPIAATTLGDMRVAGAPIEHGDGLWVMASTERSIRLSTDERWMVGLLASLAVVLLGLAGITIRAERRMLVERASLDPLTRLPNRSEFERRAEAVLAAAQRAEVGVCLLLFDLDGFKEINDTYGHQAGDEVLQVIGRRLRRAVRESDVVARWGGDEFVLMLPGIEDASSARSRAAELAKLITGEYIHGLTIGVSVGIALYPRHAETLPALVEAADAAMYAAKRDGVTHRLAGVESAPIEADLAPAEDRRAPTHAR
jgi:diguanylate cyclase (GGDEF)-like protein